jgi:very-short-patch-repair endonuclease
LVSDAVQRRLTTIDSVIREAAQAPKRGSSLLNQAVSEVAAGARSAGEAAFLELLRRAGIAEPELNAEITINGRRYVVDALWRDLGVVVEIDGMAWHLSGEQWQDDLQR